MPIHFDTQKDYLNKLYELIETESEVDRIEQESYAED